jgi:predicted dehydrogenase
VGVSVASSELLYADGMLLSVDAVFQEGTVTLSGLLYDDALGSLTASTRKKIDLRLARGDAPGGFALSFQRSIEAFYESYLRGAPLPTSGEDGLEVMRIEHALVRSHQTGRRVTL